MNSDETTVAGISLPFQKDSPATENAIVFQKVASKQKMITGIRKELMQLQYRLTIIGIAIKSYKNPLNWIAVPVALIKKRRRNIGPHRLQKFANVDGKYYWGLY